jgi:ABC-2 type transport system ATP-binding protein
LRAVQFHSLTKLFGEVVALDAVNVTIRAGKITAVLGTNGAGKSTALRSIVGLVAPTSGSVTIDDVPYAELASPIELVGAVLEGTIFHPGRTGRDHLMVMASAAGLERHRVADLIEEVDLPFADQRVGGYSLGMKQRLSIAAGLLGDPEVIVLDEPATGLDPRGVRWLRSLLSARRDAGCTIVLSSHALAEVARTADDVLILDRGRVVAHSPLEVLLDGRPPTDLESLFFELVDR